MNTEKLTQSRKEAKTPAAGKIKWFNGELAYGYIERPGQHDLFVHAVAIRGPRIQNAKGKMVPDVQPGDEVTFSIEETSRGPRAENVEVTHRVPRSEIVNRKS